MVTEHNWMKNWLVMTTIYSLICEICGNETQTFHHQRERYWKKSTMTICQRRLYVLLIETHAHAFVDFAQTDLWSEPVH